MDDTTESVAKKKSKRVRHNSIERRRVAIFNTTMRDLHDAILHNYPDLLAEFHHANSKRRMSKIDVLHIATQIVRNAGGDGMLLSVNDI